MTGAAPLPFVSVIVPVYNDSVRLQRLLDALRAQSYPRESYEIIVIDNGSQEDVERIVRGCQGAIYEREPYPTSYAARNKGIGLARGSVFAFTDSDCLPAPDWIEQGAAALAKHPDCGLMAGRVDFTFQDPDRPSAIEVFGSLTYLQQQQLVESEGFGATANLFARREAVERVGPFERSLKSSGDLEWGRRMAAAGYSVLYSSRPVIAHPAPASLGDLYRRIVRIEGARHDMRRMRFSPAGSVRHLFERVRPPLKLCVRLWRHRGWDAPVEGAKLIALALVAKGLWMSEYLRLQITGTSRQFR
jgi:cellulose synthase/poly-beta-1,6-N-acetylglucosamine synthase-like glycosyltransferase